MPSRTGSSVARSSASASQSSTSLQPRELSASTLRAAALTRRPDEHDWSAGDRDLIALADELAADDRVGDATWERLAARWSEAELVELLLVAGMYRLVSGFLNSTGVQLDEGVPGFPE